MTGSQSIIAYATVHGYLCGWDLRVPKEKFAWKLKNDNKLGKYADHSYLIFTNLSVFAFFHHV